MNRSAAATSLTLVPPEIRDLSVITLESMPPQFVLHGVKDMPTPGWRFDLDGLEVNTAKGRILIRLTEVGPEGPVIQVITPTSVDVRLGSVPVGRYNVEVRTRREAEPRHQVVQAFVVEAASSPGK